MEENKRRSTGARTELHHTAVYRHRDAGPKLQLHTIVVGSSITAVVEEDREIGYYLENGKEKEGKGEKLQRSPFYLTVNCNGCVQRVSERHKIYVCIIPS